MPYDLRRMKQRTDAVFNRTAKTMALYVRTTPPPPPGNSDDLFADATEPAETSGEFTKYYFRGQFTETIDEEWIQSGYLRHVKAKITVPMAYRTLLAEASYIDPYLDGSRFRKVGQAVAQNRVFIVQSLESTVLTNPTGVSL